MNLSTKQKQTPGRIEQTCGCQGERGRKWDGWGVWGWQMQTATFRMQSNEGPLYSKGNYIQSLGIDHDGRQYEKKNVYICTTGSLCCTEETGTTL